MTSFITRTDKIKFIKEIVKHTRNDVYAERYTDKKDRLAKYRPIKESITDEVLLRHINHEQPIGAYSVLPDKIHVLSAAYDLDAHKDKHREETEQEGYDAAISAAKETYAKAILAAQGCSTPSTPGVH